MRIDEATKLKMELGLYLGGLEKGGLLQPGWESHIKTASGRDVGADVFQLETTSGVVDIGVKHEIPSNPTQGDSELGRRESMGLVLGGDGHSIRQVNNGSAIMVEGPPMQDDGPYTKQINVPFGIGNKKNGYAYVEVKVKDGQVLEHTLEPRLREQLKVTDPLYNEFFNARRKMTLDQVKAKV